MTWCSTATAVVRDRCVSRACLQDREVVSVWLDPLLTGNAAFLSAVHAVRGRQELPLTKTKRNLLRAILTEGAAPRAGGVRWQLELRW